MERGPRRPSRAQFCFPAKENPWGVGFGHRRPPAKHQGPGSQGQPRPTLPSGEQRAGGENGLRCFPEPRRVGAVVCCPRRLSLCRMQRPEARFGRSVRRGLGDERPSWLKGHGCGLGPEGLRVPNPASPPRRTRGEWVSGTGDPQQSSRAQGARGIPAPHRPMKSAGPGPRAQKAFVRPVLLAHEREPVGSGVRAPETPSKAAGPRGPGAAQPRIALLRAQGRGRKRSALLS